jgi:hypothetical protein
MIRLNPLQTATWVDLGHGVEVLVEPIGTMILKQAGASPAMLATTKDAPKEVNYAIFVIEVAKIAITDWRGVAGLDDQPAPVTHAYIEALMALHPIYTAFAQLVAKAMVLVTEKNG